MSKKDEPIDTLLHPFRMFAKLEAGAGILLLLATAAAMYCANSNLYDWYHNFFHTKVGLAYKDLSFTKPLHVWINDGLMAMFFFVVGLEIKREIIAGELSTFRKATFPAVAAIGGMLIPALVYVFFNQGLSTSDGWGIPMATDIAFALGVLALLGDRVPVSLKIFLTALAIVDDLGAVLVIALFYSSDISIVSLYAAGGFLAVMIAMNLIGVRSALAYAVFGIGGLWTAFLLSGIHPTIAGVLAALCIPARPKIDSNQFYKKGKALLEPFNRPDEKEGEETLIGKDRLSAILGLNLAVDKASSPLQILEKQMHGPVLYLVMPIFAFANAGVPIGSDFINGLFSPLSLGIILGLLIGKQVGITACAWIAVKLGIADLPPGVSWKHVYGSSWLAAIGFTMSLFIGALAFDDPNELEQAKAAVLAASAIAGLGGFLLLHKFGSAKSS